MLIVIAGLLTQCGSAKKIQSAIARKDSTTVASPSVDTRMDSLRYIREVYGEIKKNHIDFTSFSAKMKVVFEGNDGKRNDFNAFLRMHKDSVIWVSINALLGIEAFRVMITPDSVKVLNKLDKEIQLRSVNYLQELTHIPFSFFDLQDLLMGNPVYLDSNIVSYKKDPNSISLISIGRMFKDLLTVSNKDYRVLNSKLDDLDESKARTALITYGDYVMRNDVPFPTTRKITVSEKGRLDIDMQYRQFEFNEQLNFPFAVPRNYKSN